MRRGLNVMAGACLAIWAIQGGPSASLASDVEVAATVAPVHALVAMVTGGLADPSLIVRPGASPHDYALKPSEAQALDRADLVFWIGGGLEPWMAKAVTTLAADARVVELGAVEGLTRLDRREGGVWVDHGHDDHDQDEHGHGAHDTLVDQHFWLDPDNAVIWLDVIAEALADADPANADAYRTNAAGAAGRLSAMATDIERLLEPVKERRYVVFHDAYQYFERRFDLHPLGAVSLSDADRPGPARIVDLREAIAEAGAVCIFSEPQFEPKLVETVIEGSDIRSGILDPIGAGLQPGAELYPRLMRRLADSLLDCLG